MASLLQKFAGLLKDPPADYVFEITQEGIAYARPAAGTPPGFVALEPGTLNISPLADNVLKPDALAQTIRSVVGAAGGRKRGSAVVILPDYAARVAVLGFDHFPSDPREQLSLVRFRMKKSVPFDVESAVVSYHPQSTGKGGRTECLVAVAALEIVARYEAAFRAAGLQPGWVTTASMAAVELLPSTGVSVLARLSGQYLTLLVASGTVIRLVRTVELTDATPDEILGVLFPTLAFVEDELGGVADRMFFAGFDTNGRLPDWVTELQVPAETLKSRFGTPGGNNAGLLGYLESQQRGVKAA